MPTRAWEPKSPERRRDQLADGQRAQRLSSSSSSPQRSPTDRLPACGHKRQLGEGRLKINVSLNYGMLTVHVLEAARLQNSLSPACNSYVRVSLSPDERKRTRCKSDVIFNTNRPVFDEKFSFELLAEDTHKRLLISVWNQDEISGLSQFLGCTSFGVRHIHSKQRNVSGWYHLLTEQYGRRKHLPVSGVSDEDSPLASSTEASNETESSYDELVSVELERSPRGGFGFSLCGPGPSVVLAVEQGSPAWKTRLSPGDCIVCINEQQVAHASAHHVAGILQSSSQQIRLLVRKSSKSSYRRPSPDFLPEKMTTSRQDPSARWHNQHQLGDQIRPLHSTPHERYVRFPQPHPGWGDVDAADAQVAAGELQFALGNGQTAEGSGERQAGKETLELENCELESEIAICFNPVRSIRKKMK